MQRTPVIAASAAALLGFAALLTAGPLSPPSGPIASTYKTLNDVEPRVPISDATTPGDGSATFRITQPGSYYLTSSFTAPFSRSGIAIDAPNVTLDLRGFTIEGDGSFAGGAVGIIITSAANVSVHDGVIRSFNAGGLVFLNPSTGGRVERLTVSNTRGVGVSVGSAASVSDCTAINNAYSGFASGDRCSFTRCSAFGNAAGGVSSAPVGNGFSLGRYCLVTDCSASNNGTGSQAGNGFFSDIVCQFQNCIAVENGSPALGLGDGFVTGPGTQVQFCTAVLNKGDGIRAAGTGTIRENTCIANGSAGIHLTSAFGVVAENLSVNNSTGFRADISSNSFARNTAINNVSNWELAAGNSAYVILKLSAGAISGDAGGSPTPSTDPDANFSFNYQ